MSTIDITLHEQLMNKAYDFWQKEDVDRSIFLKLIPFIEKVAVQFGNLNYQVNNGGFSQWQFNQYDSDLEDLIQAFRYGAESLKIESFVKVLEILERYEKEVPLYECWNEECYCYSCDGIGYFESEDEEEEDEGCSECGGDGYYMEEADNQYDIDYILNKLTKDYYEILEDDLLDGFNTILIHIAENELQGF